MTWAPPAPAHVAEPAQVGEALAHLAGARAVGVAPAGAAEGEAVALAALFDDAPPRTVVVPWPAWVEAWPAAWGERAPYLVFFEGKDLLGRLAEAGCAPPRFGDVHVADVLLAEGTAPCHDGAVAAIRRLAGVPLEPLPPLADARAVRVHAAEVAHGLVVALRAATPRLRGQGLSRLFELECRLLPVVADMEAAGMPVDAAAFQRIADGWAAERSRTDDPARAARLDKLLSTYAHWPRTFVDLDGRIRSRFDPLAADSGRFSCSEPNLQQVPTERTAPGLRACFRAPPGRVFVVADYAQIELRVAAALAPCPRLADVFRRGGDPHRTTAATLTGKSPDAVTAAERKLAKAINFGFLFGMGARTFRGYAEASYGIDLDEGQARRAREAFFRTYPGLAAWHRRTAALGRGGGEVAVRTALGRRKRFAAGRFSLPAALNVPVQGTAAEGFKRALVELHPRIRALGGRIVLVVHDEVVVEVPEAAAEPARGAVVAAMEAGMAPLIAPVPVAVDAAVTPHWL